MSKLTPADAQYIIDCVKHIRDWDEHESRSRDGSAIQERLELFVRGIAVAEDPDANR